MAMVKLGDVAIEKRETWTGSTQGVPIIGLEHLVPGEITLSSWDSDTDNTFSKMFRKDQVLLGRRRVYLKKAVIAPFDGICSGDITVIEAIPGKISPRLLPFIIQNERFFDYAIQGSAGSLSPRVKWEHLKDYEFNLSDYEEQESLANKLWSALKLKESYHALLLATDEMVKSRFIEMFGTLDSPKVPVKRMIEVSKASGQYGLNASAVNYIEGRPRYIRITDICDDGSLNDDIKCSDIDDSTCSVNKGDVLFARTGATVGKTYLHRSGDACFAGYLIRYSFTEAVDPEYILAYTHSDTYYDWVLKSQKVGAQPNISASQYDNMPILIPGRKEQEAFLCLYRQADKSKFELKQAIEKIDKVMRALLQ